MSSTRIRALALSLLSASLAFGASPGHAALYTFSGTITVCTGTCDSFAFLELGTQVSGVYDIGAGSTWGLADVGPFMLSLQNPGAPTEPFDGTNPTTANPLPLNPALAPIRAFGAGLTTGGTKDALGELASGSILHEFITPPFSNNGAWLVFDIGAGGAAQAQICLFFTTAGCIPGATQATVIQGQFTQIPDCVDSDGDGVCDDGDDSGLAGDLPCDSGQTLDCDDNCPVWPNADQADRDDNGIGDECECGDQTEDGFVTITDILAINEVIFEIIDASPLCDTNDDDQCNVADILGVNAKLFGEDAFCRRHPEP